MSSTLGASEEGGLSGLAKKYEQRQGGAGEAKGDRRILAERGRWQLVYDLWWNSYEKKKGPVCSVWTETAQGGGTAPSAVFFTRWFANPAFAEFAVTWGEGVADKPAYLVLESGREEGLKLTQGYAFLAAEHDAAVAAALRGLEHAALRFVPTTAGQGTSATRQFDLDGFGDVYELLFSACEPTAQFSRQD